ncbi:hypothetical protein [Nocardia sp. CWNU-33]|uniref:hypothetical protein n=1 Tax=Nocardia sp. CWNU-33 TaxID=3392117 RepID=UPI00398F76AC
MGMVNSSWCELVSVVEQLFCKQLWPRRWVGGVPIGSPFAVAVISRGADRGDELR